MWSLCRVWLCLFGAHRRIDARLSPWSRWSCSRQHGSRTGGLVGTADLRYNTPAFTCPGWQQVLIGQKGRGRGWLVSGSCCSLVRARKQHASFTRVWRFFFLNPPPLQPENGGWLGLTLLVFVWFWPIDFMFDFSCNRVGVLSVPSGPMYVCDLHPTAIRMEGCKRSTYLLQGKHPQTCGKTAAAGFQDESLTGCFCGSVFFVPSIFRGKAAKVGRIILSKLWW